MNVSEVCNICNKSSDQMLMLSCIHDPCLDCAAANFALQLQNKNKNPEVLFLLTLDLWMPDLRGRDGP